MAIAFLRSDSRNLSSTNGFKEQNEKWFTTDLNPIDLDVDYVGRMRLWIIIDKSIIIEAIANNDWFRLNQGSRLNANALHRFFIRVDNTSRVNIRTPDARGVNVIQCYADIINRG